jgi:hypothetical protein
VVIRGLLVACVAIPAILPPLALVGWAWMLWRKKVPDEQRSVVVLLLLAGTALILALSPRADVMHLAFVAALPYVLTAVAISRFIPVRVSAPVAIFAVILAGIFASNAFNTLRSTSRVASPVGNLRVETAQQSAMQKLFATVRPGDPLFVYPYMPMHYFLTQARNPTQFSFFSPGMATNSQTLEALAELQARPPEWLLFMKISREEFLRVVPKGASAEWRYEEIENWLENNYLPVGDSSVVVSGYQLRRRTHLALSSSENRVGALK